MSGVFKYETWTAVTALVCSPDDSVLLAGKEEARQPTLHHLFLAGVALRLMELTGIGGEVHVYNLFNFKYLGWRRVFPNGGIIHGFKFASSGKAFMWCSMLLLSLDKNEKACLFYGLGTFKLIMVKALTLPGYQCTDSTMLMFTNSLPQIGLQPRPIFYWWLELYMF